MFRARRFLSPSSCSLLFSPILISSNKKEQSTNTNTNKNTIHETSTGMKIESIRHCSSPAAAAVTTTPTTVSSSSCSVLTLSQMEHNLQRQLGPQAQLLVREQFTAAGRRTKRKLKQQQRQKPKRLDIDDVSGSSPTTTTTTTTAGENKTEESNNNNESINDEDEPLSIFRSSVTFRQCGFSITLCTAESSKSAEEALRLAYNGAVSTDITFFNPTLRPQDAAVFDRVRFLALGLGKMIRFSIGGGGDHRLTKTPKSSSTTKEQQEEENNFDEHNNHDEDHDDDDSPIFTCTALMKDDFEVIGRAKDSAITTTIGRSAQEAFNKAVIATRDQLTKETEEGDHALEDVRELQLFLDHQNPTATTTTATSSSNVTFGYDNDVLMLNQNLSFSNNNNNGNSTGKLLHPELFTNNNRNRNNSSNNQDQHHQQQQKNYTAKITVTDSFGNSYYVKSGDFNKTAIAAYRSCVNQIYKKESFHQKQQKPQKSFFSQVQWQVEHLTWHSGLARSLDWEFHYRSTVRSSFSAAGATSSNHNNNNNKSSLQEISSSNPNSPTYLHSTLHIGPVELSFADGVGRYRVMLNCYCNALERLLMNAPKRFSQFLPIPSVPSLYGLYMEVDRFQPTDALKGAIKGLNPQTVLGAVLNLHLGSYFQMPIERRESLALTRIQNEQRGQHNNNNNANNNKNHNDVASEDVVFVVATLPNQESTLTLSDASTIKPGTKTLILGRTTASRLACTYALRDNFPIIYNQVKDRPDFKQGSMEKENERKLQKLRSLPREKRVGQYENLLMMLREFGSEDHGWADVDVECKQRSVGLWVATVYVRVKKDNTTRDIRMSRPTATKNECRKKVILETAFTYYPQETQLYLSKDSKKEEYTKSDIVAVMGNQIASSIKPYDPVSSGSVVDQMLAILEERARIMKNTSSSSSSFETNDDNIANISGETDEKGMNNMKEDLVGDEDILRVSCELVTEDPFPKSSSSSSKFSFFFDQDQKQVRYNINILASPAFISSNDLDSSSSSSSSSSSTTHQQLQKLIFRASSLPGTPLLQAIRETVTSAALKLQLDTERIRLLIASFEEYKIPQIFRPQDLAEWLLKANFGLENVKVEVNHTQQMWVGALYVRFPVEECYWPGNDYQRQQLKKNRQHLKIAQNQQQEMMNNNSRNRQRKEMLLVSNQNQVQQELRKQPINISPNSNSSSSSSSSFGSSSFASFHKNKNRNNAITKVYEWVEIARAIAPGKREAIKLCYIKSALTNCYAHLQYMSKKSLEQQADAEEVLACDTEQYHSLLTTEQVAHFLKLSPSPLSVLRSALRKDKLKLHISVDPCDAPPLPTAAALVVENNNNSNDSHDKKEKEPTTFEVAPLRPLFSKRFDSFNTIGKKDRSNDLGVSSSSNSNSNSTGLSLENQHESSSKTSTTTATIGDQQYFECVLYTSPLFPSSSLNQEERDNQQQHYYDESIKIISKQKNTSIEGALNDAVLKALDDMLGDDDLKYWLGRWNLEMLTAENASMEKLTMEMEE